MMNKKASILLFALFMFCLMPKSHAQKGKSEISLGYGLFSGYSFANRAMNDVAFTTSSGTLNINYRYYISRNFTLGLAIGSERISSWAGFFTVAPEITVCYMDTRKALGPRIRLYGAASYGFSVLNDLVTGIGEADESGPKMWGAHISPFGIRIGRQFAGYLEVGYGYKGIVNGGLAFRFPRVLRQRDRVAE